ncbi:MAG TPA: glycosyltransferase family 9 protein [Chthonomonadaceae bacterium]|nr:glycosyltransferase family 9 protein [Chthonomonadaceae bacterium]
MSVAALPDLSRLRRLLIIRLSSIGDVTHALPVSAALGEAFPNLQISWVVEEMSAEVVAGNPYLHEVIVVPRERWKRARLSPCVWREYLDFLVGLRRRRFDVTLDLQGYAKSGMMALAAGAPYRFGGWRLREGAQLVSRLLPPRFESAHRVERFLDVARALGANPDCIRFPFAIPDSARAHAEALLCAGGLSPESPFAVLNPATGNQVRRWGAARYAHLAGLLAEAFQLPCVLIGSEKDVALCEEIRARAQPARLESGGIPAPLNLAGQTGLKELAALLERCAVQISGDTGSAHIAAALGRPVVALFGPTDPAHAGPWNQSGNVLCHRELCAPGCGAQRCARPQAGPVDEAGKTGYNKTGNREQGTGNREGPRTVPKVQGTMATRSDRREAPFHRGVGKARGKREERNETRLGESRGRVVTARCLAAISPEEVCQKVGQVLHG